MAFKRPILQVDVWGKILLLLILIAGIAAYVLYDKYNRKKEKNERYNYYATQQPLEVSAEQISLDYSENEVNADDKYRHKMLRVSGTISRIGKDDVGIFAVFNGFMGIVDVFCYVENPELVVNLKNGDTFSFLGVGMGKSFLGPTIMQLEFVENKISD